MKPGLCMDCWTEDPSGEQGHRRQKSTIWPGPRCVTHHRAVVKARKTASHAKAKLGQFGIDYAAMLAAQGGACAGCGKIPGPAAKRLAVDHDHRCCPGPTSCGKCVRGLLCYWCNTDVLPGAGTDSSKLRRLADYLDRWNAREL